MIKVVVAACFFLISNVLSGSTGDRIEFELPIRCKIGIDCFVQNLVDLDASPGILDPWCGSATYDGHKGTDIRPLSLIDIEKNIAVVAAATGRVRGIRDGEPDILIKDKADHARVAKTECGNGLVIAHEGGFETQYCHMKSGSIAVKLGETVKTGDLLGYVGASGLAQFPHLHLTVRQNGKWVDPLSGSHSGEPCIASGKPPNSYWSKSALAAFDVESAAILAIGIAGNVLIHDRLVVDGPPPRATTKDPVIVGWGWFINLKKGDRIYLKLQGPSGMIAEQTSDPLERAKASYSTYAGKSRVPKAGKYVLKSEILRNGQVIRQSIQETEIGN